MSPKRFLVMMAIIVLVQSAFVQQGAAQQSVAQQSETEWSAGAPSAPLTLIEYVSFTCPHCAEFHTEHYPRLKSEYIDTGKLYFIMRNFPLDEWGLRAAALAYCVSPQAQFRFAGLLLREQARWTGNEPARQLIALGALAGLSAERSQSCLNSDENARLALAQRQKAERNYKINSTPSFVLQDKKITIRRSFSELFAQIDAALDG